MAAAHALTVYDGRHMAESFIVDRLWPDPAFGVELDAAFSEFTLPPARDDRPIVATNMVTTIDGRAQLAGTAEGLSRRADRRLMRLYRAAYDAVGSGVGTLRAADFYSRLPDDLAQRRVASGRPAQPLAVVIGGARPIPTDRRWFAGDQPRLLIVGRGAPRPDLPAGTELLESPTADPQPDWILQQLAARGVGSFLLEGGPTTNSTFLAAGDLDELYWTLGARVLATEALQMIAAVHGGSPFAEHPREARLISVHRSDDELFLRYRFE
jgi:5-amino-6-(5-phosphoribosylamino)uracil reductase